MISVNERALAIVRQMVDDAAALGLSVTRLDPGGATLIDAGVRAPGSPEAGRLFAEVCMGGLGQVQFSQQEFEGWWLPAVTVSVSDPVVACLASQYAGWAVRYALSPAEGGGEFLAMGSGPARALCAEEPLFQELGYRDHAGAAVLALEGRTLPPASVAHQIARRCGVAPDALYLLLAPTASLVGSVQVAARVVETGMHKLHQVGFEVQTVIAGLGACPLAPVAADDLQAMGRTNDAVLYGGRAWYTVKTEDARIGAVISRLPASASADYGTPFGALLERYGGDFYQIDPLLFAPAEISLNNLTTGRTFSAGRVNAAMLRRSFLS